MYCGKCGAEVPAGYAFCMKCGAKVEGETAVAAESAPQAAEVVAETAVKKKKIPIFAIVAAIVIVLVGFFAFKASHKASQKKSDLYMNIPWGIEKEALISRLEKDYEVEVRGSLVGIEEKNHEGKKGVSSTTIFDFDSSEKYDMVSIVLNIEDDSTYTAFDLYNEYEKEFTNRYGEPEVDEGFRAMWKTKNSSIVINNNFDNPSNFGGASLVIIFGEN